MIGKIAVLLALLFCFSLPACAPDSPDDGGITPPDITIPGGDEPAEERIEAIADGDFQDGFGIMGLNSATDGSAVKTTVKFGRKEPSGGSVNGAAAITSTNPI